MKKIFTTVAVVCSLFVSISTFAQGTKKAGQDAATNKGDVILDVGVGFGGGYYSENSYNGNFYNGNGYSKTQGGIPTLSVSLQKAFWEDITIGGEIAFNAYNEEYSWNNNGNKSSYQKYNQTNTFILAKGEYHFNRLIGLDPKFDLYAGVIAGLRISGSTRQYTDYNNGNNDYITKNNYTNFEVGAFGGFRYYFIKNMAVYAEVGWAINPFRTGLAWKF